jgi:phosphoribosylglycinamide formyltransferase-1
VPTAILASGNGSNLEAVIAAARAGALPLDVRLVVSNNPQAHALVRAERAGIPTAVMPFERSTESRHAYGARLASTVRACGASLVLLLGWMHVLAPEFVHAGFDGILNLHPAYLPDDPHADSVRFPDGSQTQVFRGPRALRDAIAAKVAQTGATLIQITADVDRGPVLARRPMALRPDENEAAALERLHAVEREVVCEGILNWIRQRQPA